MEEALRSLTEASLQRFAAFIAGATAYRVEVLPRNASRARTFRVCGGTRSGCRCAWQGGPRTCVLCARNQRPGLLQQICDSICGSGLLYVGSTVIAAACRCEARVMSSSSTLRFPGRRRLQRTLAGRPLSARRSFPWSLALWTGPLGTRLLRVRYSFQNATCNYDSSPSYWTPQAC